MVRNNSPGARRNQRTLRVVGDPTDTGSVAGRTFDRRSEPRLGRVVPPGEAARPRHLRVLSIVRSVPKPVEKPMQPPTQNLPPETPDTSEVPSVVTRAASYVARTV